LLLIDIIIVVVVVVNVTKNSGDH